MCGRNGTRRHERVERVVERLAERGGRCGRASGRGKSVCFDKGLNTSEATGSPEGLQSCSTRLCCFTVVAEHAVAGVCANAVLGSVLIACRRGALIGLAYPRGRSSRFSPADRTW